MFREKNPNPGAFWKPQVRLYNSAACTRDLQPLLSHDNLYIDGLNIPSSDIKKPVQLFFTFQH